MEDLNQEETQPMPAGDETHGQPAESEAISSDNHEDIDSTAEDSALEYSEPAEKKSKSLSRPLPLLIGLSLVVLLVIAATSAVAGYSSGINERTNFEGTQVAQQVTEQYQLGIQDLEAKRYELARQRFEYVIRLDPNYPGVTEKLALVLLELNTTATPTIVPTPTLTPTPDLRGAEELFSQAHNLLADGKWTEAIETLLKLRKDDPDYQTVKVDSMLYVALRNRGVERILREGDLEGGTYDLALAEKFGLLDIEASNMRTWADLYKTGASFWGLDWGQAVYYFGQVIIVAPNLRDNTNMTASERFRIAAIKYGDVLAANKEWCLAQQQYEAAFNIGPDPSVEPTASWVTQKCKNADKEDKDTPEPPPPEATPTDGLTPTPEPTIEVTPTDEPPEEPTPTPEPTQDPYPPP
jgi:tetratricopeptide (TPR) repeat protein